MLGARAQRLFLVSLLGVGAFLRARTGHASPSAKLVYLRSAGAEVCPGEGELRRAVAVRIGYDPFFPVAQKTVVAQVARGTRGYRGKVQIVGDDGVVRGERELSTSGEDCGELVGALALAVSIALDDLDEEPPANPSEPAPPAPKEKEPQPAPPPPPPDRPVPAEAPAPPPPVKEGVGLSLSLGPVAALGTAPDAAAGASLAGALRWSSFALRLDARGELPSSKALAGGGQVATNFALVTVSACLRGRVPFVCAGPGTGFVFSETKNITRTATDSAPLFVAAARAGADLPLGSWLYLEPFGELGASFIQQSIVVDGASVHRTAPVWGAVGLHLGATLL